MRVLVTACTGQRGELILCGRRRKMPGLRFMAVRARRGRVSAGKLEAERLMFRHGECGRTEPVHRVAQLAAVRVWSRGKLPPMSILMAVFADLVLHVINSFAAHRQVAFVARHHGMLSHQRISRTLMPLHGVERWLPVLFAVAACAIPPGELTLVRIRRVAVGAFLVR